MEDYIRRMVNVVVPLVVLIQACGVMPLDLQTTLLLQIIFVLGWRAIFLGLFLFLGVVEPTFWDKLSARFGQRG